MAKILAFRPAELRCHDSTGLVREGTSAEVIIFPGVRYERWNEQPSGAEPCTASATGKKCRGRGRNMIKLAE